MPEAIEDLVEFFLDTEATEMEFEVARCRPRLTPDFFAHLDKRVGACVCGCGCGWCVCGGGWVGGWVVVVVVVCACGGGGWGGGSAAA